jgi:hypothetical protein
VQVPSLAPRRPLKSVQERQLRKRERDTQQNPKRWNVETLEESFSSRSRKKDLRQKTFEEEENHESPQKGTGNREKSKKLTI